MLLFLIISGCDLLLLLLPHCMDSQKENNGISEAVFLFSLCSLDLLALTQGKNGSHRTWKPVIIGL